MVRFCEGNNQQAIEKFAEMNYVIFSHHSLTNDFISRGVINREAIRNLLERKQIVLVI